MKTQFTNSISVLSSEKNLIRKFKSLVGLTCRTQNNMSCKNSVLNNRQEGVRGNKIVNIFLLFTFLFSFYFTEQSNASWIPYSTGVTNEFWAVDFINAQTGYIAGAGVLKKSTNGGVNWFDINPGFQTLRGIVMDGNLSPRGVTCGITAVWRTTNDGLSWSTPLVGGYFGMDIYWGSQTIYCVGSNMKYAKTTNWGASWTTGNYSVPGTVNFELYSVDQTYITNNPLFICGSSASNGGVNTPKICKSTDGGATFSINLNFPSGPFSGASLNDIEFFYPGGVGFCVASNGRILRTTNSAASWDTTYVGNYDLRCIALKSIDTAFVVGSSGKVFYTANNGANWIAYSNTGTTEDLRGIDYANGYIWAVGKNGTLIKNDAIVSEVNVSGAVTGNGNYENLTEAITAINSGAQTAANIIVTINENTSEPTSGAVLNNGAWNSLLIKPSLGSGKTVSSTVADGSALVDLNGADNVTIDGINTGGTSLTFSNASISSAAGTSTIKFQNDATNNKITNCNIYGSSRTNFTNACATVYFGANAVSTGNDNNVVSYCDIGPVGSNLHYCAVYFNGTTTSSALNNSNDTIRNCNIYDYFNVSTNVGVMIGAGNTSVSILNNKLYQTAARSNNSSGSQFYGIQINNVSGDNFRINGNTIGYGNSSGTGNYTINTIINGPNFYGIYANVGATQQTQIRNNTIASIQLTGNWSSASMIYVVDGIVSVDSNTIGTQTGNSITYTAIGSSLSQYLTGIKLIGTGNRTATGNIIGGLKTNATVSNLFGINITIGGSSVVGCSNNIIGGTDYGSLYNNATTNGNQTYGIYTIAQGAATCTLTGNTIRNIRTNVSGISSFTAGNSGIYLSMQSGSYTIANNLIHSIANGNTSQSAKVAGIEIFAGIGSVYGNFIHSLSVANSSSVLFGINSYAPACTYSNNMISLGKYSSDSSETDGCAINGIYDLNTNSSYFYNSVYITGSAQTGNSNTFGYNFSSIWNPVSLVNNIFYNSRSNNGSTGKHYSISIPGNVPNPPGISCNYNNLLSDGTGSVLGYFNNADVSNLASWKIATGKDTNSVSVNPKFVSSANLHIDSTKQSSLSNAGKVIASVTNDFDNTERNVTTPDIGADEFNVSVTGEVLNFDGVNDQVVLPASLSQNLTSPSVTEFTIEYWFKGSNVQSAVRFQVNSSTYIVAGWGSTIGNQKHLISTEGGLTGIPAGASVTDGNWHHVAMTWKKNTLNGFKSYLDGTLVAQKNSSNTDLPAMSVTGYLGAQYNNTEFTNGSLDEVRIWTRALSQNELAANRYHEIDSAANLLASYHFNNGVGGGNNPGVTSLADLTGGYNGTLTNFTLSGNSSNWLEPGPGFCSQYIEVNVVSNGNSITDGDNTPSPTDNTNFGTLSADNTLQKTFTIQNSGIDSLSIGQPFASGSDSDRFILSSTTPAGKIPPGSSASFTITFSPQSSGIKNAVLHIPNNDCDEYDYDFALTGTGTAAPAQALNFDGVNDNVELPVSLTQNLTAPTVSEFTIEYWFKGSNMQSAVRFQTSGTNWIVAGWGTPGNQKHLISTEGGTNGINVGASATDGSWHHVAMTWKKNTVNGFRSYLDGQLVEERTSSNLDLPNMSVNGYLGRYNAGSGEYINGTLDNVRIWTRELSQTELAMNRYLVINSGTDLLASYSFNQGFAGDNNSGVTTLNDGTNNYPGTLTNFSLNGTSSNWVVFGPVLCSQSADVIVKGNNVSIADGDTTASVTDNTDFGTIDSDTNTVRTFVIRNNGTDSLITGSVEITGTNANKFSAGSITPAGKIAPGDSATFDVTFIPAGSGVMIAMIHIPANDCDAGDFNFAVSGTGMSSINLNISVIIEGYYDSSSDEQIRSDTVEAYLHADTSPFGVIDSATGVIDFISHTGTFIFLNASAGNYYISISHRNSIETWSASPQNLPAVTSYDFTTAANTAFGDNLKQVDASPLRFAIYGGDENQDGSVDVTDVVNIYNDIIAGNSGYVNTDLTGDDFVDVSDLLIAYNNGLNVVGVITP